MGLYFIEETYSKSYNKGRNIYHYLHQYNSYEFSQLSKDSDQSEDTDLYGFSNLSEVTH